MVDENGDPQNASNSKTVLELPMDLLGPLHWISISLKWFLLKFCRG
jgi:hypothetical protein